MVLQLYHLKMVGVGVICFYNLLDVIRRITYITYQNFFLRKVKLYRVLMCSYIKYIIYTLRIWLGFVRRIKQWIFPFAIPWIS